MKKVSRFLALLLFFVCVATVFVACNEQDEHTKIINAYAKLQKVDISSVEFTCYGEFGETHVGMFSGVALDVLTSETVDGVTFYYPTSIHYTACNSGKFYSLQEAFDNGLLTHENLVKLYNASIDNPFNGFLNELYLWIDALNVDEIVEVRCEHAFAGVAPGHLKDISYSTNSVDIENTYRLLFSPLMSISAIEGQIDGGGYVKYDFFTADNETYSIFVSNNIVKINNQYYKFVDTFYYAFQYADVNCNAFITYDIPAYNKYEIYTYANEGVKIGDFDGLGEFEFCVYDGLIESTPSYYLRSSGVNLLILSSNQFMIEGDDNTVVYQITGEKDFSELFTESNVGV